MTFRTRQELPLRRSEIRTHTHALINSSHISYISEKCSLASFNKKDSNIAITTRLLLESRVVATLRGDQ